MKVAIIDIGSNAIRAAIYHDNTLGAVEILNEKFRSDLHVLLEFEDLNVKHSTYSIFNYFENIFQKLNVTKIFCVATEVLRKHRNAHLFIAEIKTRYNIDIQILSGEEEARLTAEGLISSMPFAEGIVVDLGGGSLEFAEVYESQVHQVISLPIGTKAINKLEMVDPNYIADKLSDKFTVRPYENLYLIGGALRLIGRCYIDYNRTLIKNLHNLTIEIDDFLEFLHKIESLQKFQTFCKQYKISRNSVFILHSLIRYFQPKNIIISTFGLKEGVRWRNLPNEEKKKDICLEKMRDYLSPYTETLDIISYKNAFANTGIELNSEESNLFAIALILSQLPRNIDRSYKGEWIINFILTTDIPLSKYRRSFLLLAMSSVFQTKSPIIKAMRKNLSKSAATLSNIIGAYIRIACLIDGPALTSPSFDIDKQGKYLNLSINKVFPQNIFEKAYDQLKTIGISARYLHQTQDATNQAAKSSSKA